MKRVFHNIILHWTLNLKLHLSQLFVWNFCLLLHSPTLKSIWTLCLHLFHIKPQTKVCKVARSERFLLVQSYASYREHKQDSRQKLNSSVIFWCNCLSWKPTNMKTPQKFSWHHSKKNYSNIFKRNNVLCVTTSIVSFFYVVKISWERQSTLFHMKFWVDISKFSCND